MSVVTLGVGLALSSLIDSLALRPICFVCMWNRGLCLHEPPISLLALLRSCRLGLDCFRIAALCLVHKVQFFVANVLTALMGVPCQMDDVAGDALGILKGNCAKGFSCKVFSM